MLIAIAVPRAILLVPFGVVADRRPGRTLMLTAHIVRGLTVGAIAALAVTGGVSIPLLALLGAVFGAADALYMPAQQAFLPRTLDADRLPSANALLQGTYQITSIVGPPIAGVVIAVTSTGVAFAVDAISFVLAAIVIAMLSRTAPVGTATAAPRPRPTRRPSTSRSWPRSARGIGYVLRDRALLLTMAIALVLNFALNGPVMVGMPWLADQRFSAGPAGLGLLAAAWAAGALVGVILAGSITSRAPGPDRPGRRRGVRHRGDARRPAALDRRRLAGARRRSGSRSATRTSSRSRGSSAGSTTR